MAASVHKKPGVSSKAHGGVSGAIVPPRKQVDNYPLMTYVAQNCSFDDASDDSSLENEEVLKVANDRRVDELLSKAALSVKGKVSDTASPSEEADRKNALEILHSMELARNLKETWKVPEQNTKDNRHFLHPLKRFDKEDDYFSGIAKVKQARERKRCRSDEVVLLDNGKLVPKNGPVDYSQSNELAQLPIKFSMPVRAKPPRVPSVGLPFTPGPPIPTDNNRWMQRSGSELFSNVDSQTLLVNCNEDNDLARAIAESIRTAKEEQQRHAKLETLYQSQCKAVASASGDKSAMGQAAAGSSKASWGNNSWEGQQTLTSKNRSMSMDSTNWANWDKGAAVLQSSSKAHDANNNSHESESAMRASKTCLDQRPRHKEQCPSKSPPPPMMTGDFEKSVSRQGTVITLQTDNKKHNPEAKRTEEKKSEISVTKEKIPQERAVDTSEGKEIEFKQDRRIPRTSHVAETFDSPKITATRLPTSKPSALMTAMKNFTDSSKDNKASHNVEHSAKITTSTITVPLPELSLDSAPEKKDPLNQPESDKKFKHNYVGHIPKTSESSPKIPPLLVPPKESIHEEPKLESRELKDAKSPKSPPNNTLRESSSLAAPSAPGAVPALPDPAAASAPNVETPSSSVPKQQPQQPVATSSSSNTLEEMLMALAQSQLYQTLLMQQSMGCTPQVLQNGQNFGGVNGQLPVAGKQPEMGQACGGAASMPVNALNTPPNNLNSLPQTMQTAGLPGSAAGLPNTLPGSLPGLPNTVLPNMPEVPNPLLGGIPGMPSALPGATPGLLNSLPGGIPGMPSALPGATPGLLNPLPGGIPGMPSALPGATPGLLNPLPGGIPGMPSALPGATPGLLNPLPGAIPGFPSSYPGMTNPSPGFMPELNNPYAGMMPGVPNPYAGMMPGLANPYAGMMPGLPNAYAGMMPGLANLNPSPGAVPGIPDPAGSVPGIPDLPGSVPGFPDPPAASVPNVQTPSSSVPKPSGESSTPPFAKLVGLSGYPGFPASSISSMDCGIQNATTPGFGVNPLSSMQGLQSNLPGFPGPASATPTGILNCNSFGGISQSLMPQPGGAPLMTGRGRGRLANPNAFSLK